MTVMMMIHVFSVTGGSYPWYRGNPDNLFGQQHCVNLLWHLRRSDQIWQHGLNDDECDEQRPFICNRCITTHPTSNP